MSTITIKIYDHAGSFGENKDIAKRLRIKEIMPSLADNQPIVLDFTGVTGVTQSFVHALIAEPIREFSDTFFSLVSFKSCSEQVQTIVRTVAEYMQESLND